jgi:endo-1,4-beta-xylanase
MPPSNRVQLIPSAWYQNRQGRDTRKEFFSLAARACSGDPGRVPVEWPAREVTLRRNVLRVLVFWWAWSWAWAQTPLIPAGWSAVGQWGSGLERTILPLADPPEGSTSSELLRLRVLTDPPSEYAEAEWSRGISINSISPVAAGDLLVIRFWARSGNSAAAATRFMIERSGEPYNKLISFPIRVGEQWREFHRVCRGESHLSGGLNAVFYQGYEPQVLEITGLSVMNYGQNVSAEGLGIVTDTYEGREPDAPWRAAAAARIDQHRKANLTVEVRDSAGRPVSGARIRARMQRHSFGFGSAVAAELLVGTSADSARYREIVASLYNKVVFENDLKWTEWAWENVSTRPRTFQALQWLLERGISVRGHCLVWPGWSNMPPDVRHLTDQALRKRIHDHVLGIAGHPQLLGLEEWDVINEPYSNHDVMDRLGKEETGTWFELAHQANPGAGLYINDYNILAAEGADLRHQDYYYRTIDYLKNTLGAPIHGIGMQSHFSGQLTPPERVFEILERFSGLGLILQITEFDINIDNEALQADYLRDFMTVVFSHPAVNAIVMWGFWEGRHWLPKGALYRMDWTPKPHGLVWENLVFSEWWTDQELLTDSEGKVDLRGFKGDYRVTVEKDGQSWSRLVNLDTDAQVRVDVPFYRVPRARR